MFSRRKKNLKCNTDFEIVVNSKDSPSSVNDFIRETLSVGSTNSPSNAANDAKNSPSNASNASNTSRNSKDFISSPSNLKSSKKFSRSGTESLSPNGARAQRSGSFEKLSGILGPEVIEDIKNLENTVGIEEIPIIDSDS